MTPKERAAMQQALEALHNTQNALLFVSGSIEQFIISNMTADAHDDADKAITALREALAEQAELEPLGTAGALIDKWFLSKSGISENALIYAAPVQQAEQEPVACKHEWFRTGAMEIGESRCIHCGKWNYAALVATHEREKQAEQEPIILKFPRQNKNGWTIDWKTISSVEDAIEDNEFKPCPEGVEQVLLALEKVYPATQPVSQEPVGTAGELFTLSTLERLDVRPSTKVYLDSTPPVAEIVLKSCIYFDSIDFSQKPPFLRYDTGDSTPQDNWNVYCDIQDELREFGYELTDSDVDHDTVCGDVTPMAAAIRNRGAK